MIYRLLILTLFITGLAQAGVYKYINKQGKVSYSDIPVDGAEKVTVPPVMTYRAAKPITAAATGEEVKERQQVGYQRLEITWPEEQGTVRSNQGIVAVEYHIEPALQTGHRLELSVDGKTQDALIVQGLERGEHRLQLHVLGAENAVLLTSQSVTFYLHHQSKR
ncbi:MAG: DUF4124 domain-containing protein [Cycloclasticus sp.]|nr:DUF4124 domain-containing protein [Cycloclasticus sp.]MBQ0789250.1 DUF4124 domain-containing protein [Cycloclasticus sp.]